MLDLKNVESACEVILQECHRRADLMFASSNTFQSMSLKGNKKGYLLTFMTMLLSIKLALGNPGTIQIYKTQFHKNAIKIW